MKAIVFERGGHTVQRLNVASMTPLAQDESFFFGGQEINFDGWLDLLLMTEQGSANAKAEYWVYDPAADRFRDLGEFPMFSVEAVHKRLSTAAIANRSIGDRSRSYQSNGVKIARHTIAVRGAAIP